MGVMAGLREHQKAGRRRRILEAARHHFLASGYEAATIEAIAETAEVSSVTVYNYYGTKRGLLLALVAQSDDILITKINEMLGDASDDPIEAITRFAETIRDHVLGYLDRPIWRYVIATSVIEGSSHFGHAFAELDREMARLLGRLLETIKRRGALRGVRDCAAVGETLFKLQNARFIEFIADDAMTDQEMAHLVRSDLVLILGERLAVTDPA